MTVQKRPVAIITRPEADAAELVAKMNDLGGEPIMSPVIEIRHSKEMIDLTGAGALAFTSANGVRAFVAQSTRRELTVYAVGPITANVARSAGFQDVRIAESDVESLARLILQQPHGRGHILHISGEDSIGDLVGALTAAGIEARRHVGYAAEPVKQLSALAADALRDRTRRTFVLMFSPRSATLFLDQVTLSGLTDHLENTSAICLSEAVADKARQARWAAVVTAAERHTDSMVYRIQELSDL